MTAVSVAERLTVARLAWGIGLRTTRRALAWPGRKIADFSTRGPRALAIAPQDIRTTDPAIADDIYAGHFHFAGRIVDSHGTSPFDFTEAPQEWETALMGFAWLRHLRAAETALARANARSLVDEWITRQNRQTSGIAWQPQVAARRLISWLSHSPLLLEGADANFYRRFMKSIGRHVTFLSRQVADGLGGEAKLTVVLALMQASLCATGLESSRRKFEKLLVNTLQAQVLPDGGHISRNPQVLVDLLLDLLPLRQAFAARGLSIPQELISCVDRVMPMLRMMRHGDATLALFNGMGVTAPDTLATVLAYDDARAQPVLNAHYAGYQRLEGGTTIVVCDAGAPPPPEYSSRAHAGTLSFELSSQGQRIIVNCGAPSQMRGAMREAARLTAAHSTLILADTSSCRFATSSLARAICDTFIVAGPSQVETRRNDDELASEIDVSHDGYSAAFRALHRRRLTLAADGWRLEGADTLSRIGKNNAQGLDSVDYALRFHLHPQVRAGLIENGQGVLLALPTGEAWIFHASGLPLALEESVFFAGFDGPRATTQIVIHGNAATQSEVPWVLSRSQ
ncbi:MULTISPECIES: heparinase II/III family protein [unclassified Beijerinckia]|uniref:heparinase II/III family protein n=1 Tax=unclassified Beijerinckia TaxID=2638183 RepID=UPI0008953ABF|nr:MULTISPECIES: heparinase II/III family protein [unclassified Beijerinckia]MDH7799487.1 putative heparinase superfamily protein [Beijerinckia sp. GAS462]SED52182.1 Uncharacterized conserved protein, heparinase superfamily [Beijerinckia sp. 28-YEA-48]